MGAQYTYRMSVNAMEKLLSYYLEAMSSNSRNNLFTYKNKNCSHSPFLDSTKYQVEASYTFVSVRARALDFMKENTEMAFGQCCPKWHLSVR